MSMKLEASSLEEFDEMIRAYYEKHLVKKKPHPHQANLHRTAEGKVGRREKNRTKRVNKKAERRASQAMEKLSIAAEEEPSTSAAPADKKKTNGGGAGGSKGNNS